MCNEFKEIINKSTEYVHYVINDTPSTYYFVLKQKHDLNQ